MKKFLILAVVAMMPAIASAQQKNHVAIQATPTFAPDDESSATHSFELAAMYVRDLGKVFHVGAGLGLGTSNPVKLYSMWKVTADKKEDVMQVPVFVFGKVDFGTKPSHGFFNLKAGTRYAVVSSDYDNEEFNPYVFNAVPSIGYDIRLGTHKLGIAAVIDVNVGRYQYLGGSMSAYEVSLDTNVWANYGISVTFEW